MKDETWFTETIIVKGDTIVVKINEGQVVNWTQPADWNGGRGAWSENHGSRHNCASGA